MKESLLLLALFWSSLSIGGEPFLVKDINPTHNSSSGERELCSDAVEYQGNYYFCAGVGTESAMWVTDGTTSGTRLVSSKVAPNQLYVLDDKLVINSSGALFTSDGTDDGTVLIESISAINFLTEVNGKLIVSANNFPFGYELWTTDGTTDGTLILADINEGRSDGVDRNIAADDIAHTGNNIFFVGDSDSSGKELWVSDGTPENTRMVVDIRPGSGDSRISNLTAGDGKVLFTNANLIDLGTDVRTDFELWSSDGTESGTVSIFEFENEESSFGCGDLAKLGEEFLFCSESAESQGYALWTTDGTSAGTHFVKDISEENTRRFAPEFLLPTSNRVFFESNEEIWSSDGTGLGTVKIVGAANTFHDDLDVVMELNGELVYIADSLDAGIGLRITDSLNGGSSLIKDFEPLLGEFGASGSNTQILGSQNGLTYFIPDVQNNTPTSLWKTDGTELGTIKVGQFPVLGVSTETRPTNFSFLDGAVLFGAGDSEIFRYSRIWIDNSEGPAVLKEITAISDIPTLGSIISSSVVELDDEFYFLTQNNPTTRSLNTLSLWRSDGTNEGTAFVKDVCPHTCQLVNSEIVATESSIFILAENQELWVSDGTESGTTLLMEVGESQNFLRKASNLTVLNDLVLFVGTNGTQGLELWKSDGTIEETEIVKDIKPGFSGGFRSGGTDRLEDLTDFAILDRNIYFVADDGEHGAELWRSGGTESSTHMVRDIFVGETGSFPQDITVVNDTLFFSAFSLESGGYELWKSKGSAETTEMVIDIEPSTFIIQEPGIVCETRGGIEICQPGLIDVELPFSSLPKGFVAINDKVVFRAYTRAAGYELWVSDGSAEGTSLLSDVNPGPEGSADLGVPPMDLDFREDIANIRRLKDSVLVGGNLYLILQTGAGGSELWRTDGTIAGTGLLTRARSGSTEARQISHILKNSVTDNSFFFAALGEDGLSRMWQANLVTNQASLSPNIPSSPLVDVVPMIFFNGRLYFSANNGIKGNELWALAPDVDLDGAIDEVDNCPSMANPFQLNFDMDSDGDECDLDDDNDGVLDNTDAFPFDSNESIDTDGDGIGNNSDPDDDNDLINDVDVDGNQLDNCPLVQNTDQLDLNRNGVGDACEQIDLCIPIITRSGAVSVVCL